MIQFTNPTFLWGFLTIIVPIIIHLFNFRRFKTVYFSNVKLLQDIVVKTRRESRVQHLLVLFLRICAISALVLAFAQPYVPQDEAQARRGNAVTIFVDNSFSMGGSSTESTLLQDAVATAKRVVDAFSFSDEFVLVTQDFLPQHARIVNKDEMMNLLDEVDLSPNNRPLSQVIAFQENALRAAKNERQQHYYISDFQRNSFPLSAFSAARGATFLLPLETKEVNNVSIDSCWFLTPVFKVGQQVTLNVRVHNWGTTDIVKLPLKLYVNDQQKSLAALDLKANSYTDFPLQYSIDNAGTQCGKLTIDDAPILFDDQFFFVYDVSPATEIVAISEKTQNRYVNALYGRDSLFVFTPMNVNKVNYSQFKTSQLVVLDEVTTLSSGLASELRNFLEAGGNLLVFPSTEIDRASWQSFLTSINAPIYQNLVETPLKIGKINTESFYFKGSLESTSEQMEMPMVLRHFEFSRAASSEMEVIMQLEDGAPLLTATQIGKGKLFLSAVALNDDFGAAHKHALFFVPLHNIGIKSQIQSKLYNIIGKDGSQAITKKSRSADDVFRVRARGGDFEFIPEQRAAGNETMLFFHGQIEEAGFYDVSHGGAPQAVLAFNYDRNESNMSYLSENELLSIEKSDSAAVEIIDANNPNITQQIAEKMNGKPLWFYFIFAALAYLLAEICVLRFWGRATYQTK